METNELYIPVPWGHIAVKTYGKEDDPAVLAIHGIFDNAGSFDTLIPLLPTAFYYLCVDLPGNGKSSAFPPYTFLSDLNYIFALKLITDHLAFKKYIAMGHSRGGQYLVFFAQLYPHLIDKLIVIDSYYLLFEELDTYKDKMLSDMESLTRLNANIIQQNIPEYKYDEAITKAIKSRIYGTLDRKSSAIMIQRMLIPVGNGKYRFSVDPRSRILRKIGFNKSFALQFISKNPVTCPCLYIIASRSRNYFLDQDIIFDSIKKHNNEKCDLEIVTGGHYVHLIYPERVAPVITKFLTSINHKL